jgi:hypothetical protein
LKIGFVKTIGQSNQATLQNARKGSTRKGSIGGWANQAHASIVALDVRCLRAIAQRERVTIAGAS